MKKINFILLTLTVFVFNNCTSPIKVAKRADFNPEASITVVNRSSDSFGVRGKLENLLLINGFNVISVATAQKKLKYKQQIQSESNKIENKGEVRSVQELKSLYALNFTYTSGRGNLIANNIFTSFNAQVVRLYDGKIVASTSYSQTDGTSKKMDKVLKNFVDQLSK